VRYAEAQYGEHAVAIGIFMPGDSVTIQVLDLATDALVPLDSAVCSESVLIPGFFRWSAANVTPPYPTGFHQCLYVMTNAAGRTHAGKLVIGGYPSDSAKRRFQGAIHIDVTNGVAGTAWDIGTPENPSNNVPNARVIADRENIPAYKIRGSVTVTTAHQDWSFEGVEPADDYVTFSGGASIAGSQFLTIGIRGDLVGGITCKECLIGSNAGLVTGLRGTFTTCGFDGILRPAAAPARIQGLDLASQSANLLGGGAILDFNSSQCIVLGEFKGIWSIRNIVHPAAIVAMAGAGLDLTLESTVAGGQFILLGTGELHDDSTSVTSMADGLIRGSRIDVATGTRAEPGDEMALTSLALLAAADAVLAEPVGDHQATADSLAAVLRRISHHSTGRAKLNASNPLQWTLDVYEDDDPTMITAQFNLKRLDGDPINAANPLIDPVIADVDPV